MDEATQREITALMKPSVDIANSAMTLASERCKDLGIPPVMCWMLLREIADLNARDYTTENQQLFNSMVAALPDELRKAMPNEGSYDVYEALDEMAKSYTKYSAKKKVQV